MHLFLSLARISHLFYLVILGFALFCFCGCEKVKPEIKFIPNTGQIQILNGSGKPGAAEIFRDFLTDQGFDVIEFGNAANWNYNQTLVVTRTEKKQVAEDLAKIMNTENLITLLDSSAMVEATVFVGKDYEELIKKWQKQKH